MLGSIIGDIVGSIYEFNNIKTKDFQFFSPEMEITDDSILSFATADWLLHGGNIADVYLRYVNRNLHPMGSYGTGFITWCNRFNRTGKSEPYNSCGNGSAMRVGPVGWAFNTLEETLEAAKISAECTHNHPEGIKGAQASAAAIFLSRNGASKAEIKQEIEQRFGYNLNFSCDEIRDIYGWGALCQDTVPQAIVAFLEGNDFEDCIRNVISIGGDSDTLGCITGSIAEAFYGIPINIRNQALNYLNNDLRETLEAFESRYSAK